jgi:hypothetical protein
MEFYAIRYYLARKEVAVRALAQVDLMVSRETGGRLLELIYGRFLGR